MLKVYMSNQFKRDLKLAAKRGYNLDLLDEVVMKLANWETLADSYRDHGLSGKYTGYRECHIQPDWLLIYRVHEGELILLLARTGRIQICFEHLY